VPVLCCVLHLSPAQPSPDQPVSQDASRPHHLPLTPTMYYRHKLQYATQRAYLKECEDNLDAGQCVVYEDFVNYYAIDGSKVYNLVFTIVTMEGGIRHVRWVNNYCTDEGAKKADAYFVRDVWDHNLRSRAEGGTGEFDEFESILRTGDSGPHFHNYKTIWFESTIEQVAHTHTHTHKPSFFFFTLFLTLSSHSSFLSSHTHTHTHTPHTHHTTYTHHHPHTHTTQPTPHTTNELRSTDWSPIVYVLSASDTRTVRSNKQAHDTLDTPQHTTLIFLYPLFPLYIFLFATHTHTYTHTRTQTHTHAHKHTHMRSVTRRVAATMLTSPGWP
jgi:hypothetical protein